MKKALLISLFAMLTACRDTDAPVDTEVHVDERALAHLLAESILNGASALTDSPDEIMNDPMENTEITQIFAADGTEVVLEIDGGRLTNAIRRGVVKANTPIIDFPEPPERLFEEKEQTEMGSLSVKILGNRELYGALGDEETLISKNFTGEDTRPLEEWFEKVTSDPSKEWQIKILSDSSTLYGTVQAIFRAANAKGLERMSFGSAE